jgi:AraC-like DNA-binding protein/ketosteroid isomerase-like protein
MDPRVRTALALMQENLKGAWSPDTLARAVNLSPSRFHHLFKAEIGMAPAHYHRALRLEQAAKLLQTSRLTVKQIMNEVGVEDKSHFAREFKKAYGLTPTAYRAKACTRPDSRNDQQIAELASIFVLFCETSSSIFRHPERAGITSTSRSRSRNADVDPHRIIDPEDHMNQLDMAEAYYTAMQSGDYEKMGSYLHNDVKYSDPRWPLKGKDQVWPIAQSFSNAVKQLKTVGKFSTNDQVVLVHDVLFYGSEKPLRTAVLMTFDGGLIKEIGLISDISQHIDVCTEIFSYKNQSNLATAEAYYSAMESGDYEKMGSYLHSDVKYSDPRWPLKGKDQVWPIARSFSNAVKQLKTVGKFSTNDQVMLVHDVMFHRSEKPLRTAVLMTFDDKLIKEIGLISDISQHIDVCTEIFSYSPQP